VHSESIGNALTREQRPTPIPSMTRPITNIATSTAPARIAAPMMKQAPATMFTGCKTHRVCQAECLKLSYTEQVLKQT